MGQIPCMDHQVFFLDGTKLFIADTRNNRVLIYNSIPTENNASADVVIGQPDMVSNSANQGGDVEPTLYIGLNVFIPSVLNFLLLTL